MVTTITASYTVIPNEPTPNGHLWLSDTDQIYGFHYTPTIYIYKLAKLENYKEDMIERMKRSLSKILVYYYPMAGRLCWSTTTSTGGGRRIELDLNAKGAVLLEAETTKTMSDYGDFSPSDSTKDLVPSIDRTQPMEDFPLLVVQLTRFPRNEGLAVGVAFCHVLSDGVGAIRFINSWAKIARGGGGDTIKRLEPHEIPFLDRTILKFPNPLAPPPRFEHTEFKPQPLTLGRSDNTVDRNKKRTAALLRLPAEQVEKLKKKANKNDDDDDDDDQLQLIPKQQGSSRPYSRYEAIAAHIWRCASKARELNENQLTVLRYPVEIRNRMIPPLPGNYFGNALAITVARDCVGEITSKPLSYVAQKIREASELVTNEYIRSQIDDVITGQKNLDDARALFLGVEEEGKNNNNNNNNIAPFFGNPNLHLVSWMSMPMYEADFGWGKPMHVGLANLSPFDRGLILLSPDGDGSVIVSMHFQIAHMQLFNKFFYEDI